VNSTPEQPGGDQPDEKPEEQPPQQSPQPPAPPAEPYSPPQPGQPYQGQPPYPGHPNQGQPPYPGQPLPPQQSYPGQQHPDHPHAAPFSPTPPARRGLSFGAWVGIGLAIGFGLQIIGVILLLVTLSTGLATTVWVVLWPFLLIILAAIVLMFFAKTRGAATGILIVSAGMFLVIIGPCIALLGGFSG